MTLFELIGLVSGVLGIIAYFSMEENKKRKSFLFLLVFSISFFAGGMFIPRRINPIIIQSKSLRYSDFEKTLSSFPMLKINANPLKIEQEEFGCPEYDADNPIDRDWQILLDGFTPPDKESDYSDEEKSYYYERVMEPVGRIKLDESYEGLIVCISEGDFVNEKVLFLWSNRVEDRFILSQSIWSDDTHGGGEIFSYLLSDSGGFRIIQVSKGEWKEFRGFDENGEQILQDSEFWHEISGYSFDEEKREITEKWKINVPKDYQLNFNELKSKFGN